MALTVCPFCFRKIDSSHLAYQCACRERRLQEGGRRNPAQAHRQPARDLSDLHAAAGARCFDQLPDLWWASEAQSLPKVSHRAAD